MELAKPQWDCQPWQMVAYRNPSWFNSAWLGVVTNFLNLPMRVFFEVILIALNGRPLTAALMAITLPFTALILLLAGLLGKLSCARLSPQVLAQARINTPEESAQDAVVGAAEFVKAIRT